MMTVPGLKPRMKTALILSEILPVMRAAPSEAE